MKTLLLMLLFQTASPEVGLASDFRSLCIDHQGAPAAAYAAAEAAGWTVDPDDARLRVRDSGAGTVTLVAVDNEGGAICYVSADAELRGVDLSLLAATGLGIETVRLRSGDTLNVVRTVDGQPAPRGWAVGVIASSRGTTIMLIR